MPDPIRRFGRLRIGWGAGNRRLSTAFWGIEGGGSTWFANAGRLSVVEGGGFVVGDVGEGGFEAVNDGVP